MQEIGHYNEKCSSERYYLQYHEKVDIVFYSEDRVFPLEMVLFMRGASLNEQENVTKGVHQVCGIEDLLIHLFFEHFLNEIGDCE
jgi:hypothetical protein